MPRRREHCDHCVQGQPSICNYCGRADYRPAVAASIITRANHQQQGTLPDHQETMDAVQQALAALTAIVQQQQQAQQQQQQVQQQQQQAQQQQGQALQIALQAIQHNQNAVASHPLPTFSGTIEEDVSEKREIGQPNAKFWKKTDSVSSSATSGW